MKKKIILLPLVSFLLLSEFILIAWAHTVRRTQNLIIATILEPETVDPGWLYDVASAELVQNVYDTLIFFDVDRNLPPNEQGKTDVFVPSIATEWSFEDISEIDPETGLTWVQRWYFKIRGSVYFHNGDLLTCEDVEYSFDRWMVQCRTGGPTWMITEPLLGIHSTRSPDNATEMALMIRNSVQRNATHVWFNLVMTYPPLLTIIAQSWAGILSKDWAIAAPRNDWPGTWGAPIDGGANWTLYNDPEVSPLDTIDTSYPGPHIDAMCGTGPYMLNYWDKGVEWALIRFISHWQGWPTPGCGGRYPEGYLNEVIEKFIPEWATRKLLFLQGDCDFCYVPTSSIPELILNWPMETEIYVPGIRCFKDLPQLVCLPVHFFNYNVSTTSTLLGPGFDPNYPYVIAEDRIPINFFSDIDVRKGFAYSFDYDTYIEDVYMDEAERCITPIVEGLPYHNPAQQGYSYNLTVAEECFMAAGGGIYWDVGFSLSISYNTGNVVAQIACQMIKAYIESLNSKFHIDIVEVDFPTYLGMLVHKELTGFVLGWLADYPDPHNFAFPFMHSQGDFTLFQSYHNSFVDELVEEGIAIPDTPWYWSLTFDTTRFLGYDRDHDGNVDDPHEEFHKTDPEDSLWLVEGTTYRIVDWKDRQKENEQGHGELSQSDYIKWGKDTGDYEEDKKRAKWKHVKSTSSSTTIEISRELIYYELQQLYVEDVPSVPLCKPVGRQWERDWISGWYYNPIYPGGYFKHYWKGYIGDINLDYTVDIFDLVRVAICYGYCDCEPNWHTNDCSIVDLNGDGCIDIFDLVIVAGQYGC